MSFSTSILDSNRLINLKNQHGLKIAEGNTVSVYSGQTKLRKMLVAAFSPMLHSIDLENLVDKIVDRCDDTETISSVTDYFNSVTSQEFIKMASGKIRVFFKTVKNFNDGSLEYKGKSGFNA